MDVAFIASAQALTAIPEQVQASLHMVCFDWATLQSMKARDLHTSLCTDHITPEAGAEMDEFVSALTETWYRHEGQDFTTADGVSLGAIYEGILWYQVLVPAYKYLAAVTALIDREAPERIYLDARVDQHVIRATETLAGMRSIRLEPLTTSEAINMASSLVPWRPWSLRPSHRMVLHAYNAITTICRIWQPGKRIRILASYYPTLKVTFNALATDGRFEVFFLETPPPSILIRHLVHGARFFFPRQAIEPKVHRWVEEIQSSWRVLVADQAYRRMYVCGNLDGWPIVQQDLHQFFQESLPKIANTAASYHEALSRQRIDMLLLPFDVPPVQRTVIEVGRVVGTPSMVVLHGLPGMYTRRDNCTSDYFAAWGQGNIDAYHSLGCAVDRMRVVGSPMLDQYIGVRKRARRSVTTVLVLTNPLNSISCLAGDADPERYILSIMEALRDLTNTQIVIRPHPAEAPSYYTMLLCPLALPHVIIDATTPISKLLSKAVVLITSMSSVALEATALDLPVLWFHNSKVKYPQPFAEGGFDVVTDVEDLRTRTRRVINEGIIPSNNSSHILSCFAGPMDGQASERVLDWIHSLTPRL